MLRKKKEFPSLVIQYWLEEGERDRKPHQSLSGTALSQFHAMETLSIIGNKLSILEANICYMRENAKAQREEETLLFNLPQLQKY